MNETKVDNALNSLVEYMTISDIAFHVMTGNGLFDNDMKIVYEAYKTKHDELLKVLVNDFG